MLRRIILTLMLVSVMTSGFSKVSKHTADSIASLLNKREIVCDKTCPLFDSESSDTGMVNTLFIDVLAIIGTVWLYSNYRKKYFIVIGAAVVLVVSGSLLLRDNKSQCVEYSKSNCLIVSVDSGPSAIGGLGDFEQMSSADTSSAAASATSEFSEMDSASDAVAESSVKITDPRVMDPIIAFTAICLIGFGIRYHSFIRLRGLFLLAGMVWFGFYRGGCSCMISSFQDMLLGLLSWKMVWVNCLWICALLVSTYFFGRIWCGWMCHLGAIQDFLYHSQRLNMLTSAKSQKYLRITRYVIVLIWILQVVIMRRNIFCEYDPFKSLFNMVFVGWQNLTLLLLLLVSSVLIYRPFCRMICPVGVMLGLVAKIPGARKVKTDSGCVSCGLCSTACQTHAIVKKNGKTSVDNESCIVCGECIQICRKKEIKIR